MRPLIQTRAHFSVTGKSSNSCRAHLIITLLGWVLVEARQSHYMTITSTGKEKKPAPLLLTENGDAVTIFHFAIEVRYLTRKEPGLPRIIKHAHLKFPQTFSQ